MNYIDYRALGKSSYIALNSLLSTSHQCNRDLIKIYYDLIHTKFHQSGMDKAMFYMYLV